MTLWSAVSVFFVILMATCQGDLSVGKDFYFAFPCQLFGITQPSLIIVNYNSIQAMVTIDSSLAGFRSMERTVDGNSALQVTFTDDHIVIAVQVCDVGVSQQGFRVQTSVPVALYVLQNTNNGYNAAQYMVLPSNMLSTQYMGDANTANRYYGIAISKQDGTSLNVGGNTVTLNRLDVYYSYAGIPTSANYAFAYILTVSQMPTISPASSVMASPRTYGNAQMSIAPSVYGSNLAVEVFAISSTTTISVNGQANTNVGVNGPYIVNPFGAQGGSVVSVSGAGYPIQALVYAPYIDYAFSTNIFLSTNINFYAINTTSNAGYAPTLMIVAPLASTGNILLDGQVIPTLQYRRIPNAHEFFFTTQLSFQGSLHSISITTLDDRYLAYVFYPGSGGFGSKHAVAMNLPISS